MKDSKYISIKKCSVQDRTKTYLKRVDFSFSADEAWLVTGPNGGGKAEFVQALAERLEFVPDPDAADYGYNWNFEKECGSKNKSLCTNEAGNEVRDEAESEYYNCFQKSTQIVSLEEAARLIQEERERDESEILDKEDIGRTARQYICEVLGGSSKKNAPLPEIASRLETLPQIKLCGVEKILDRGLRYLSTGEIRRTLLCRALLSGCRLLVLSDPFAGLDVDSRKILLEFFNTITERNLNDSNSDFPKILLCMERFTEIPESINRVIEFTKKSVSFCGARSEYEKILQIRMEEKNKNREQAKKEFITALEKIRAETKLLVDDINQVQVPDNLIEFTDVNVGWGENSVLKNLNWKLMKGEHWLIKGPNGSGKTTLLELITGDNMQVFREDIKLFGKRRGTGETIWDIKKQLGIVSYRLHVEYRMVGGTELLNVIISGFHDSIGLYEAATDFENATALQWLKLAGFAGREHEAFSSLSYGEQRAILILRAAVKSPRVLILDEPCHGLDEEYREKILDLIETVAETGTTTVLHVTHDASEVLPCEKNVLELLPGQDPMYRIFRQ